MKSYLAFLAVVLCIATCYAKEFNDFQASEVRLVPAAVHIYFFLSFRSNRFLLLRFCFLVK